MINKKEKQMILEVHDTEEGNTLTGRVKEIDYDYQAEQWVQDLIDMEAQNPPLKFRLAKFILQDDHGQRAAWTVAVNLYTTLAEGWNGLLVSGK